MRKLCLTLLTLALCGQLSTVLASANLTVDLENLIAEANRTALIPVIIKFQDPLKITTLRGVVSQELQYAPSSQRDLRDRRQRLLRNKIVTGLKRRAKSPRAALERLLHQYSVKADLKSLWSINAVALKLPAHLVDEVAKLPGIDRISVDMLLTMNASPTEVVTTEPLWNLEDVNTNALWDKGIAGEGVVVAILDSGVDLNHPDLASRWRGGANSWLDPYGQHEIPVDFDGHGTQALSLVLGGDASGYQVGMAPNAQWIAAKIFDNNNQTSLSAIHEAFQWVLDPDGDPTTDDAPDVVNNSWGFTNTINQCYQEFTDDIRLLREAGIAVVFSAGNFGPFDETSISPANDPGSISVGSVDQFQDIERSSSRGPGACDGGVFPKLVAPGSLIFSADVLPIGYNVVSGTSFAAPHVTGAIALLKSAFPTATVSQIETALYDSAADLGDSGTDDHYGYGMLDLAAAYDLLFTELGADSPGLFVFSEALYSIDESTEKLIVNVRRLGGSTGEVSIDYHSSDDQAISSSRPADFKATSGSLVFADGETLRSFEIEIHDDDNDEKNETFYLNLTNPSGDALIGSRSQVPVTILDDDGPGSLSFSAVSYAVNETHDKARVSVIRTGGTEGSLSVDVSLTNDTAIVDSDFLLPEKETLLFSHGEIEKVLEIPLVDDEIFEGNESFHIQLIPSVETELETPSSSTVVILDDDPDTSIASIHVEAVNYSVSENNRKVTLRVLRSGNTDSTSTVKYTTVNGSAKSGEDFRETNGELTFWPNVKRRDITIEIYDDGEYERESSFTLVLTDVDSDSRIAKPSAAIIRIRNDDALPFVSLSSGNSGSSTSGSQLDSIGSSIGSKTNKNRDNQDSSGTGGASGLKIFDLSLRGYSGIDENSLRGIQTLGGNLDESVTETKTDAAESDSGISDCSAESQSGSDCPEKGVEKKDKSSEAHTETTAPEKALGDES
ncbi:MAG: S8 family serine peptidase [Candidatus Thiodiazotropha sp. (ex Myrtea sp. 'scaly one' KF741663)]|nr:S8 family serine peptidase [Candidatus Thiodiazotropha sp. (ex Myrtea sp. 'scaly one' KF741663)]